MSHFNILALGGDHNGHEVVAEAVKVLRAVEAHPIASKKNIKFNIDHDLLCGQSIDAHGIPLTPEVLAKEKKADAVTFGAVGGPKWGMTAELRPETSVLDLQRELKVWDNIRPTKIPSNGVLKSSPLKESLVKGMEFIILRELCGRVYFGEKKEIPDYSHDVWGYHRWEIKGIAHMCAYLARKHGGAAGPSKIMPVDKANVLAAVCRLWQEAVTTIYDTEFPEIPLNHQLSDSLALLMVKNPRSLNGIVLCDNIFGDLFSDEAAGVVGSLGFSPSASLARIPGEQGKEKAIGLLPMMLRHRFNLDSLADAIDEAVSIALDGKADGGLQVRTGDGGGSASTTEIGDAVVTAVKQVLDRL